MTKPKEEWEIEFDEKFPCTHHPVQCDGNCKNKYKRFILKYKSLWQQEAMEEIVKVIDEMSYCGVLDSNEKRRGYDIARNEIIQTIKPNQK